MFHNSLWPAYALIDNIKVLLKVGANREIDLMERVEGSFRYDINVAVMEGLLKARSKVEDSLCIVYIPEFYTKA